MKAVKLINTNIKKNIIAMLSFIILIQPFMDLVIGISIENNFFPTAMSFLRLIILMFLLYYFAFINEAKNKNKITILLSVIGLYLLLYFVNMGFSINELKGALKVFYFPIMFLIIFSIFEEEKTYIDQKYLLLSLFIYAFIIVAGFVTNTAFNSYDESKVGTSGYFHAANEISGIISILLPFIFSYIFEKINLKKIIYFLFVLLSIFILGTKTPFISLIICAIYYLLKQINKNNILKIFIASTISVIVLVFIITMTPIYKNIMIHAKFLNIDSIEELFEKPELIDHFLLGSRLKFLNANTEIYLDSSLDNKILGIGYTNNSKLVEMDFYDVLYRQGLVGFLIFFGTAICVFLLKNNSYNKRYILPIVLIILISTIVGHIITAPAVSTFVAFIMCGFMKEDEYENKRYRSSL